MVAPKNRIPGIKTNAELKDEGYGAFSRVAQEALETGGPRQLVAKYQQDGRKARMPKDYDHVLSAPESAQPSMLESAGGAALGVTDSIASTAGQAAGYVQMGMLPVMVGGMLLPMVASPIVKGASKLGFQGPTNALQKFTGTIKGFQDYTVGQAAEKLKISPAVGSNISNVVNRTADFVAPVTNKISKIPGLGDLHPDKIKAMPKAIGQTSLMHTAFTGAFVTAGAVSLYGVARDFGGADDRASPAAGRSHREKIGRYFQHTGAVRQCGKTGGRSTHQTAFHQRLA